MNFKDLFKNRKRDKTRQNLLVSLDDRQTGDHEVLSIKTTSTENIALLISGGTNLVSIHPEDLQDALNRIKAFLDARTDQPKSQQALGINQIDGLATGVQRAEQQLKQQEEKIIPVPEKKLDLSN